MPDDFSVEDLPALLREGRTIIDVRAPIEFSQGSLPTALNRPLLDDLQRSAVGTTYKKEGQEAAVRLGHQLISGSIKEERLQSWKEVLQSHPDAFFCCFRGGLRSQISRQWLREAGIFLPLFRGGYKEARNFLLKNLEAPTDYLLVVGATGSGKTELLQSVSEFHSILDLERAAHHRGSAFGAKGQQPSQASFENQISADLLKAREGTSPVLVEDESRMIGKLSLPTPVITQMRESPVLWIEESLPSRVERIFKDYVLSTALGDGASDAEEVFVQFKTSMNAISKKLGGLRTAEILQDLEKSAQDYKTSGQLDSNRVWIEKLLRFYYDPMYEAGLRKRTPKVAFRGTWAETLDFLKSKSQTIR